MTVRWMFVLSTVAVISACKSKVSHYKTSIFSIDFKFLIALT